MHAVMPYWPGAQRPRDRMHRRAPLPPRAGLTNHLGMPPDTVLRAAEVLHGELLGLRPRRAWPRRPTHAAAAPRAGPIGFVGALVVLLDVPQDRGDVGLVVGVQSPVRGVRDGERVDG